jgi:hypothetical protein
MQTILLQISDLSETFLSFLLPLYTHFPPEYYSSKQALKCPNYNLYLECIYLFNKIINPIDVLVIFLFLEKILFKNNRVLLNFWRGVYDTFYMLILPFK